MTLQLIHLFLNLALTRDTKSYPQEAIQSKRYITTHQF